MRVLYVSKASRAAAHRAKLHALAARTEVTLLTPDRWGAVPFEEALFDDAFERVTLPTRMHGHNHLHLYRGLGRVLIPGAFDLIHVDEEPYSLVTAQLVRRASRIGVPSLFFAWQNIEKRLPPPFGWFRDRVFERVAGGIAGTETAAAVLRAWGFRGPIAVIPQMGVDLDRFRPDPVARRLRRRVLGLGESSFVVGFVGRLAREKGVLDLLEAIAVLPDASAVLVGSGPERAALSSRARRDDLEGRVRLVGEVPSLEVAGWLRTFDCLVLPSRTTSGWAEQFGRVLTEAMACAIPVVGSDSGEIPRVIGDAGLVFPEGDRAALSGLLAGLASDPASRRRLGERGRTRVETMYGHEHVAHATAAFYEEILGSSHPIAVPARGPGDP